MLTNALWEKRNPGVNRLEAIERNDPTAASFYAELGFATHNTEKMQELEKEGFEHLRSTGQLDAFLGTSAYIKGQQPVAPSSAGLAPVVNSLSGSGFVEPTGPGVNHIKFEVQGRQAQADSTLDEDRQALDIAQGRLKNAPTPQEVHGGIANREAKTEGGALKAAGEVAKETATQGLDAGKQIISTVGQQMGAALRSIQEHPDRAPDVTPPRAQ